MNKIATKLLLPILLLTIISVGYTQSNNTKKIQMGIVLNSGLNFNNMTTKFAESKVGTDLSIGINIVKNFNDNLGFVTGFEFDFSRLKYTFNDTSLYLYNDSKILTKSENNETNILFQVKERTQTPIYLSIPTMFVFRTDYFGYIRYFAKFGMRHSFTLKSMTNDEGIISGSTETKNLTNMILPKDLSIYKGSIGVSAGMEWNYYGTSTMVFELGYYYGINNIHRGDALTGSDSDKNKSLFENKDKTKYTSLKNTQNQLAIKVSFLF